MTDLTRLDGPGAAAVSDQLVAVYRAAMGAAPFHETEVETGWFAEELAGQFAVVWIAVLPDHRGRGLGRRRPASSGGSRRCRRRPGRRRRTW